MKKLNIQNNIIIILLVILTGEILPKGLGNKYAGLP
jgi:hypothetical protein